MEEPLVSCITPTYGRFNFLKEMYWCWLNQTYQNKELIIVNDQPNLFIECDNPSVKVFNFQERFVGLGAKRNFCVENLSPECEFVIPFDDDDLTLPEHISSLVDGFKENPQANRTKNKINWIAKNNELLSLNTKSPIRTYFGASCFRVETLKKLKFKDQLVINEDGDFYDRLNPNTHLIEYPKATFIYRMGMGIIHAGDSEFMVGMHNMTNQKNLHNKITNSVPRLTEMTKVKLVPELSAEAQALYEKVVARNAVHTNS